MKTEKETGGYLLQSKAFWQETLETLTSNFGIAHLYLDKSNRCM
ncbi:MAG: hypothetical protein QMD12_01295 [Candidatus Aenigmarchaeota archaeon]|nr:hypothetical protein [Candidatus Aenigmarchaeota archaeon]